MKFSLFIISLLIILISIMIWILINQKRFLQSIRKRKEEIDTKYIELKYRIDLIITAFTIIIAVIGLIGYGTYDDIKRNLTKDFDDQIINMKKNIYEIDSLQRINKDFIENFELEKEAINSVLIKSGKDANKIKEEISLLSQRNIKNPNIYLCKFKYPIEGLDNENPVKIFFRNLKTIDGQNLPRFKNAPMIFNSATNMINLHNVTSDYFEISQAIGNFDKDYIYIIIGTYND